MTSFRILECGDEPEDLSHPCSTLVSDGLLSGPGEFHPEALPEPYVSLSTDTAPMVKT